MTAPPPPSPEEQLSFLTKLQRLFQEGDFTATYKYALLTAFADLAVERGHDDGAELRLRLGDLAERFIALYWRQATPYAAPGRSAVAGVLVQNLGAQAMVVTAIERFQRTTGASTLPHAKSHADFRGLVAQVSGTVSAQPIRALQNLGGKTEEFLFRKSGRGEVCLLPGVTYCLRRFHPLIQQVCQAHWADHIRTNARNRHLLGGGEDLERFLFGVPRQSLTALGQRLQSLDGSSCFYCGERANPADVDHFVPFSLYGRDLASNFVLAHSKCNRSKSDTLAGRMHAERWLERLFKHAESIADIGEAVGIPSDAQTSLRVAAWAYGNAHAASARAWLRPTQYESIGEAHLKLFMHSPSAIT